MRTGWIAGVLVLVAALDAEAQCRTECRRGEARDPYGCCVRTEPRRVRVRRPEPTHPERFVGDASSVITDDPATELANVARVWLAEARSIDTLDHERAIPVFRRAAGASLLFLRLRPEDRRAGRMRAVLVFALDGAGMSELAEREAAALGGPRPSPPVPEEQTLESDTILNLAWAHQQMGQRMESARAAERRLRALARFRRAADFYRLYVELFPDGAQMPGARSQLANALVSARRYLDAAAELDALADAVPSRRTEALLRAVVAYQQALDVEIQAGRVTLREGPPEPSMRPPWAPAVPLPEALQRLVDARDRFLSLAPAAEEPELRRRFALDNARTLYHYAHFDDATPRLLALVRERCDDATAREAFDALTVMRPMTTRDPCSLQRRCSDDPECFAVGP